MKRYDIVVVGGGPSGLTFARLINKKYKVLLIERRNLSCDNGKPCGGLLAPDSQLEISKQRLSLPSNVLVGPQLFNVKTMDINNDIVRYYPRHYINIDRHKFELFLKDIIPTNIEILEESLLKEIEIVSNEILITYKTKDEIKIVSTKYLVGADGANSLVRKFLLKKDKLEKYICIQEWYDCKTEYSSYGAIFDKQVSNYYSWYIQKENKLILGSAIKKGKDANDKFSILKAKFSEHNQENLKILRREGQLLSRPKRFKDIQFGKKNIFLIGESAGLVSPSSGEGISYALKSGAVLASVFNRNNHNFNKIYKNKMLMTKIKILFKKVKSCMIYNNFFRKIVMLSNVTALRNKD